MHYKMTEPCDKCPYRVGSGFKLPSLVRHASGEFPCHKACDLGGDGLYREKPNDESPHCAGALIFLEKQGKPHQMMRINERFGFYEPSKLNMDAPVGQKPSDFVRRPVATAQKPKRSATSAS